MYHIYEFIEGIWKEVYESPYETLAWQYVRAAQEELDEHFPDRNATLRLDKDGENVWQG